MPAELRAKYAMATVPVRTTESTPSEIAPEDDSIVYEARGFLHFVWTINLNGFFYSHIFAHNSEAFPSRTFSREQDSQEFQLFLCPRTYDKWASQHCSLFLVQHTYGGDVQVPRRIVIRCRIPGIDSKDKVQQYFDLRQPELSKVQQSHDGDGYVIAQLFNFISDRFFLKHLNVVPYFQIVADLLF